MASKTATKKTSNIRGQFLNTQQTEAYRQLVSMEKKILASRNKADLDKMKSHMEEKQNYFTMYKKPEDANSTMKSKTQEHDREMFYKSLPFHRDTVNEYDPKTKKDRNYTVHKAREAPLAKELFAMPVTSSQSYGWREPIDTLNLGLGLKNSFPDPETVNFRENSKKEKAKWLSRVWSKNVGFF